MTAVENDAMGGKGKVKNDPSLFQAEEGAEAEVPRPAGGADAAADAGRIPGPDAPRRGGEAPAPDDRVAAHPLALILWGTRYGQKHLAPSSPARSTPTS